MDQVQRDSMTYQAILEEGRIKGLALGRAEAAREILLRLGEHRLGRADDQTVATIVAIADLARLRALTRRLVDAASWDDLLASQ